jgi:hypothetical protein
VPAAGSVCHKGACIINARMCKLHPPAAAWHHRQSQLPPQPGQLQHCGLRLRQRPACPSAVSFQAFVSAASVSTKRTGAGGVCDTMKPLCKPSRACDTTPTATV